MIFKLDQNMPRSLTEDLAAVGSQATTCEEEGLSTAPDCVVASHAQAEGRILVTFDLDFADIRRFPPGTHPGILVFRLSSQDVDSCKAAFSRLLAQVSEADLHGNLVIVEDDRIRIRRPQSPPPASP